MTTQLLAGAGAGVTAAGVSAAAGASSGVGPAAGPRLLRTHEHPAAAPYAGFPSMDHWYRSEDTFDGVYRAITEELVATATDLAAQPDPPAHGVVYAVPGSPSVAEETVTRLRADPRVAVVVHPAPSFLDLAWTRLGVDPVDAGVTMVDAMRFAEAAAGLPGPFLVAQCWSTEVLSAVKLAPDAGAADPPPRVTLLHHLGLPDERVEEVAWADLDRALAPDHLTSLWVPRLAAPVARELVALDELVRTLRARCPWDREQTHASLARHLLEESYEVLDALAGLEAAEVPEVSESAEEGTAASVSPDLGAAAPGSPQATPALAGAVAHLEEELGDLLFQVFFHARLAAEEGRFTMADVAAGVHAKLVSRHPHVFGDVVAESAADVAAGWEVAKLAEKGRSSVTDGIPATLPSLSLAGELLRKAPAGGLPPRPAGDVLAEARGLLDRVVADGDGPPDGDGGTGARQAGAGGARSTAAGALLLDLVDLLRRSGVDPELALRAAATALRDRIRAGEPGPTGEPPQMP